MARKPRKVKPKKSRRKREVRARRDRRVRPRRKLQRGKGRRGPRRDKRGRFLPSRRPKRRLKRRRAAPRPTPRKARRRPAVLPEWLVSYSYKPKKGKRRSLDFYVVASDAERAMELVAIAIAKGKDDNGYDLTWARRVPWKKGQAHAFKEKSGETKERVEVH